MYEAEATADMLLMTGQSTPAMAHSDAQPSPEALLIRAVLDGQRDSFGKLYELYAPMVHGILLARVPRTEVEDLVQDIFLHAFRKLTTLRDANAFGGWLAMITRNRAMDFHRYARATVEVKEEHAVGDRRKRAKAEEILNVIRSLPDAYRETLVLRLVEGMTGPEIASRTGLTHASVRVNLHRGMKLLREKLGIRREAEA
jgi:RNA polymerase sigma-70 factor (ECF subfamily)